MTPAIKPLVLAAISLVIGAGVTNAQGANDQKARALFFYAEEAFEKGKHSEALDALEKAKEELGASNARIAALEVKSWFALEEYETAQKRMEEFYAFKPSDALSRNMAAYTFKIEAALDRIKKEEQRKAESARQEAERRAEAARIEAEKQKRIAYEKANSKWWKCPGCSGTKQVMGDVACATCDGNGRVKVTHCFNHDRACETCKGTGWVKKSLLSKRKKVCRTCMDRWGKYSWTHMIGDPRLGKTKVCRNCNSSENWAMVDCRDCNAGKRPAKVSCPRCEGKGEIFSFNEPK